MIRVRILKSSRLDQDVEAHLSILEALPRVALHHEDAPITDEIALILRQSARLIASDQSADLILTVGEPALVSALVAWRGPIVHLPVGLLSSTESRLLRWQNARESRVVVVSTHIAAAQAISTGISSQNVRVIRSIPPELFATRNEIRDKIGIETSATCVVIAGRVRNIGGHAVALAASSVLAFRDPSWRMLIDPGPCAEYVRRFGHNTGQPHSLVLCDQCSASELSAAADAMIVDSQTLPSYVSIASAAAQRVPTVVDRKTWRSEQLESVPAVFMADSKARSVARAVLDAVEGRTSIDRDQLQRSMAASQRPESIKRQWIEVLQTVCGHRKPQAV